MVGLDTGIRGSLSIADLIAEGDSFISRNIKPALNNIIKSVVQFYLIFFLVSIFILIFAIKLAMIL